MLKNTVDRYFNALQIYICWGVDKVMPSPLLLLIDGHPGSMFRAQSSPPLRLVRIVLTILLVTLFSGLTAEIVQIGTGTEINQWLPIEPQRNYSYSQQIYFPNEIGGDGWITSLAFQYQVTSSVFYERNNLLSIWLGHNTLDQLADWEDHSSLSLCFDGVLPLTAFSGGVPGSGWMTIELANPFYYDGISSLVIAVHEYSPGHAQTTDDFFNTPSVMSRGIIYSMPDPIDLQAFPFPPTFIRQCHPNLRLNIAITHLEPHTPSPANGSTNVSTGTDFTWLCDSSSFDFYLGREPEPLELIQTNLQQSIYHLPEPLSLLTTYYWQVKAWHEGESYPGPVWSFCTQGEELGPPQEFSAFYQDGEVHLSWQPPLYGTLQDFLIFRNEQELAITTATQYLDTELSPGAHYVYYARARNPWGQISNPSASASVYIPYDDELLILGEDYESATPFSSDLPGWTILDLDDSPTWSWSDFDFPHQGEPCGWMVFSTQHTTPPQTGITAHSGSRMLFSPDAINPPDNNWLISPLIYLGKSPSLSFWARSATADYGLERLRVLVSTGGLDPASFTPIHTMPWLAVPAAWTQYQYELSQYQKQTVRIAWNAVSIDALALFLDDLMIRGEGGWVGNDECINPIPALTIYPNPSRGKFRISLGKSSFDLEIFDVRGRRVYYGKNLLVFDSELPLASGIYLVKARQSGRIYQSKMVLIK